ncbi:MAG: phenylacetate-CoA oxygenase subunit PaaJ [Bacteroidetes bacterium]|nr:phenylacetate-CoA oxygenase subunit PaaJ [Bacteroidota bacterium]
MSIGIHPTPDSVRAVLETIPDPEVPAISIVELGIIRAIRITVDGVCVTVTPTYSGCPAMHTIRQEIERACREQGIGAVTVETVLAPPWTTDWISDAAKEKLRAYGIAPPHTVSGSPLLQIELPSVACPYCSSHRTSERSHFGSTACKAMCFCDACRQPFEHFKSF